MKLDSVGDVNIACQKGKASELIQVAEALQEKKIVQIAEEIDRRFHAASPVRLVLITGPTSSGKTTFCKRLSVQLKACGLTGKVTLSQSALYGIIDGPRWAGFRRPRWSMPDRWQRPPCWYG